MASPSFEPVATALDARFRRARHVVCYWATGGLTLHNYRSGIRTTATPLACQVLDFFDTWRTPRELMAAFDTFEPGSLCGAIGELFEATLLECDTGTVAEDEQGAGWTSWNPAAGFFHAVTKDVRYGEALGRKPGDLAGQEWKRKEYPHATAMALPRPDAAGAFPDVLLARRTWRRFEAAPLSLQHVATLLQLTFGVQRWCDIPGRGPLPFKTSPSGGACHPVEAYLLALHVDALERGWYHYDPTSHALARLAAIEASASVTDYLPTQPWYGGAGAIVFMTAVFGRAQARYRYARAYRSVLIEAGHLCQTFCLTATWLGLAPFCTAALADSRLEQTLGIDGVTESVLYAAGVGTRPAGVDWALYPGGSM